MARVLLIDDCSEFRVWARRTLERDGVEVIEARDALAGLQRAVEDGPDCILVSAELAGLDGFDVASRIANDPSTAGRPVLVAAERTDVPLQRAATRAGARGLLARSFRPADLLGPVREALWASGARRIAAETRRLAESAAR